MWLKKGLGRALAKCTLALQSMAARLGFPCLVWLVTSVRLQRGGTGQGAGQAGWVSPTSCVFRRVWVSAAPTLSILRKAGEDQRSHSQAGTQSASSLLDGNRVRSQAGSVSPVFWEKKQCGKKCTCPDQMAANLW